MERLILGLQTTVIGMTVVFVSLYALSLVMEGLQKLATPGTSQTRNPASPPAPPASVEAGTAGEQPEELVAVITAALAAYLQQPAERLQILAVNPVAIPPATAAGAPGLWKTAGRLKLQAGRLALYTRKH